MSQVTYIARKGEDVDFANGTFSGTLAVTGVLTHTAEAVFNGGLQLNDSDVLTLGTGDDVTLTWDGTNLIVAAAADDSLIEVG